MEVVIGGRTVRLGSVIGHGAEGEVYALDMNDRVAVKVYFSPTKEREDKIRAMVSMGFAKGAKKVAFPQSTVCDMRGRFIGFAMQRAVSSKQIHLLSSPESRLEHFTRFDYRDIVRTAADVARAVWEVHRLGCVMGDINEKGVLVSNNATVTLVDSDSFQFSTDGEVYLCEVAREEFTPPELLCNANFTKQKRMKEHDLFGLAVLIFQLLFMGRHPFGGRSDDPDDKQYTTIKSAIIDNQFAYTRLRRNEVFLRPPNVSVSMDDLPSPIQKLFERAFGNEWTERPCASEWVMALSTIDKQLVQKCRNNKYHIYPEGSLQCVWCRIGEVVEMFPYARQANNTGSGRMGITGSQQSTNRHRSGHGSTTAGTTPSQGSTQSHKAQSSIRQRTPSMSAQSVGSQPSTRQRRQYGSSSHTIQNTITGHQSGVQSQQTARSGRTKSTKPSTRGRAGQPQQKTSRFGRSNQAQAKRYSKRNWMFEKKWFVVAGALMLLLVAILWGLGKIENWTVMKWDDNNDGVVDCKEAWRHGIAPIRKGHPAYRDENDGDGDGVACERRPRGNLQEHIPETDVPWDENGDGRVTCAEARKYGITPVYKDHPAYKHMWDRDGDGVVCEGGRQQSNTSAAPDAETYSEQQPETQGGIEWDDNNNGIVSCAEARRHGIAPVHKGDRAYPYMRDGDGDGVVCESSQDRSNSQVAPDSRTSQKNNRKSQRTLNGMTMAMGESLALKRAGMV